LITNLIFCYIWWYTTACDEWASNNRCRNCLKKVRIITKCGYNL